MEHEATRVLGVTDPSTFQTNSRMQEIKLRCNKCTKPRHVSSLISLIFARAACRTSKLAERQTYRNNQVSTAQLESLISIADSAHTLLACCAFSALCSTLSHGLFVSCLSSCTRSMLTVARDSTFNLKNGNLDSSCWLSLTAVSISANSSVKSCYSSSGT